MHPLIILFVITAAGFLLLKKLWAASKDGIVLSDNSAENAKALDGIIEMEDVFFQEARKGKTAVKFMHLFYLKDIMILKSLFQSEGIPYKIENEHLPSVLAGYGVTGFNHTDFYILKENYEDALKIVTEYAKNKKLNEKSGGKGRLAGSLITMAIASSYIPGKDETAGIVVFKLEE